ncbi:hypothetical protein FVEG_16056 [Fusarium verticillioides 7600]|uniref:Uncharacterized protein n=1 Tax=Gibberella moniliformis (strain M3125 / FGSC 7600) TaxID=334819 RepID=W7MQW1_GIBM7|nr:hypothetical protein FVEG_16056 [Fusarium verticillioides 7600]EWG47007.1 hypothetical protein FVEG_16056 [Fusarium verticillioides 7600]
MDKVLVPTEGHLDAATGFVVFRMLQETAVQQGQKDQLLKQGISDYEKDMHQKGSRYPGGDPLDLGMGLRICHFYTHEKWSVLIEFWDGHIHQHDQDGLRPISHIIYAAAIIPESTLV